MKYRILISLALFLIGTTLYADYSRVKALHTVRGYVSQKKYYIGDRYEREENSGGTVTAERLFLGGDAYSAPLVLQKTGAGSWTPYVIGRDYLGSITDIVTTDGTSVAKYSYDAWGRMRDPETLTPYASTSQPSLLLGRGYCGHEHLSNFGLINMNARLYDPVLGRFLSPDPYVQSPDFSQNFNRYAYALNNPLKYTDESGESLGVILGTAYAAGFMNWLMYSREFTWRGLGYFGVGALMGLVSSSAYAFTAAALSACGGVSIGTLVGMGSGAITGGVTGFITNGLNNLLSGNNYMDGSREAARKGLLCGAIAGAVTGGITGGVNAFKAGKNVWWGNNVKYNRSQWSFINTNKPDYIIKYDIPNVGSLSENDCVPTTWAEMEALLGGKRSYDEFVEVSKYIPKTGVETTGLEYKELVLEQFEGASELAKNNWSQLFDPCFFQSSIDNHTYFSFYFHGHADVVRSLWVFERNPLLNTLTFRQPLYNFSRIDSPRLFFIFKF